MGRVMTLLAIFFLMAFAAQAQTGRLVDFDHENVALIQINDSTYVVQDTTVNRVPVSEKSINERLNQLDQQRNQQRMAIKKAYTEIDRIDQMERMLEDLLWALRRDQNRNSE